MTTTESGLIDFAAKRYGHLLRPEHDEVRAAALAKAIREHHSDPLALHVADTLEKYPELTLHL